jgi:hypothetical protein
MRAQFVRSLFVAAIPTGVDMRAPDGKALFGVTWRVS